MVTALTGLAGVILGVFLTSILTRRSQRTQWIADNKKEEYRELMSTLARSMTMIMMYKGVGVAIGPQQQREFQDAYNEALRVLSDRIFIAEQIKKDKIYDRWTAAMAELHRTNDIQCLDEPYEQIKGII